MHYYYHKTTLSQASSLYTCTCSCKLFVILLYCCPLLCNSSTNFAIFSFGNVWEFTVKSLYWEKENITCIYMHNDYCVYILREYGRILYIEMAWKFQFCTTVSWIVSDVWCMLSIIIRYIEISIFHSIYN